MAGSLWILLSDWAIERLFSSRLTGSRLQTLTGLLFVAVTAGLLFLVLRRYLKKRDHEATGRRKAEAELRESEARLRRILDNVFAFIGLFSLDGEVLEVNRVPLEAAGLAREDVIGRPFADTAWWSHSDEARRQIRDALARAAKGETVRADIVVKVRDSKTITLDATFGPLKDPTGRVTHVVGSGVDVTTIRKMEVARSDADLRFRQLAENIRAVFWMTDPELTTMLYVSPAYEVVWGRTCASLYADPRGWTLAVHPEDRPRVLEAIANGRGRGEYHETYRIDRPDGSIRWIRDRAFPILDKDGALYRIGGIAEDITEQRRLEEQFQVAQRMDAIGTLAGGIAHDFNNILAAVLGYAELARVHAKGNPVVEQFLEAALEGGVRAVALVRQILTFSRRNEPHRKRLRLKDVVGEALRLLRATLPSSIQFDVSLGDDLPVAMADGTQVLQVVMNLSTNAWHAMRERPGRLGIRLEAVAVDETAASATPGLRVGPYVRLSVSDTGHGMDPETQRRIFEPFFTTKAPGEGTGLGLAVVHGIVKAHGGAIEVFSRREEGTTFHVYFPALAPGAGEEIPPPVPPSEVPRGRGERVLFLDDEESLALLGERMLHELGYASERFTSASSALAAVRADPLRYDLVVTDLTMPVMTGTELAQRLHELRPNLPLVLCTGFLGDAPREPMRATGIRSVLMKPLTLRSLGEVVRRALAGDGPA